MLRTSRRRYLPTRASSGRRRGSSSLACWHKSVLWQVTRRPTPLARWFYTRPPQARRRQRARGPPCHSRKVRRRLPARPCAVPLFTAKRAQSQMQRPRLRRAQSLSPTGSPTHSPTCENHQVPPCPVDLRTTAASVHGPQGRAQFRTDAAAAEPSPGADVAGVRPVPAHMQQGAPGRDGGTSISC